MSSARHSTAQRTPAAHARARRARSAPAAFACAALALALTACATDDPTFCSATRPCPQGQRCDLPNRTCVGPADGGMGEERLVALDLNGSGWRDGPAFPVAASVMALGRDQVANAFREDGRPHALRVHLQALHGWLRSTASGPPKPVNGVALRWDDECRARIPPRSNERAAEVSAVRLEETRFTLQLDAFGPGLALRLHNRSSKALRLEWEQRVATKDVTLGASPEEHAATVASPSIETKVHTVGASLCDLSPGEPCTPTELPSGSTLVDHLTFLRAPGKGRAITTLVDPWGVRQSADPQPTAHLRRRSHADAALAGDATLLTPPPTSTQLSDDAS
ncbi:MAG: hypothetical protein IPG96_08765 [Proteobacteria bacterium]|nr:hypothetical protein [Pseudomonadota bacterium]